MTLQEKAEAILVEGRLCVERLDADGGLVVASCRSSGGESVYRLGYDPGRREWRCTCPVPGKKPCSHLTALWLVVFAPTREVQENDTPIPTERTTDAE